MKVFEFAKFYLKNSFKKGTLINDYNLLAVVIIGSFGHPIFAILHLYVFDMPWDNIVIKSFAGLVCLSLATKKYWSPKFQPLFKYYWHFMLIYNLPFLITLTALNNHFIKTWFLWEAIMFYTLTILVPQWFICLIDLLIGVGLAIIFHNLIGNEIFFEPSIILYNHNLDLLLYALTYMFAIFSGLAFSYSNAKCLAEEERAKIFKYTNIKAVEDEEKARIFKSLAGSIAHELRNPLNTINLIGTQINNLVLELDKKIKESPFKDDDKNSTFSEITIISNAKSKLLNLASNISNSISNANNIINIILGDLREKKIDSDDFIYLETDKILPEILEKFGYRSDEEKAKVKILSSNNKEDNFAFKADPDRLSYVIFNLLKNALYYSNQFPEFEVTIGTEKRIINDKQYNVIYVKDNGVGIQEHIISKLFSDFYTYGKKEGTGLGLSFCKRNMQMFGGEIICESKYKKWTKFSLLFPVLSEEEVAKSKIEIKRKKILLVDDQEVNLIITKTKLEKIFPQVSCDIARGGKEAIRMANQNKYQLILMDIQMPEIDGIEATSKIRMNDKEIPIIALTSLNKDSFLRAIDDSIYQDNFSYYLSKSSKDNLFYRGVSKWMMDSQDDMSYVEADFLKILSNKKIILADDQQINRTIIRGTLESAGIIVAEAKNGKELLEIYQKSLDQNGKSNFDAIITDIIMPPYNGDEAVKEIRAIEALHKINNNEEIPIIAISGQGEKEDIYNLFKCQITDYFIKGSKPELLLRVIANYIN